MRPTVTLILLAALLAACVVGSACLGDARLSVHEVVRAILDGPGGESASDTIVWAIRLPRIFQAALVGALLSLSGLAFQALLRNALADPYIVGVSAAATVGSEAVLLYGGTGWLAALGLPAASFLSGVAALIFVYTVSRRSGRLDIAFLLLMGSVLSSFLSAIATLMLVLGPARDTSFILGRLMGSLQAATFGQDVALAVLLAFGLLALAISAYEMNILTLGDVTAQQLGVPVECLTRRLMIVGSLLATATVAVTGAIGFVGFVVPHLARRLAGTPDHRRVLPLCLLLGAILLTASDTIARAALPDGREIPVGIITALVGGPVFLNIMKARLHRQVE